MGDSSAKPYTEKTSSAGRLWGFNRITGAEDGLKDTLYMTRLWFGRLRFHIFHRGDQDPDCHDHPWAFWTFPLRPYLEEVLTPIRETVAEYPVIERVLMGYDKDMQPEYLDHITITEREKPTRYQRSYQVVHAWRWHYRPADHKHRVLGMFTGFFAAPNATELAEDEEVVKFDAIMWAAYKPVGNIPTIVWRHRATRKWGFTKERNGIWCWVPWKKYVFEGGKSAPCQEE